MNKEKELIFGVYRIICLQRIYYLGFMIILWPKEHAKWQHLTCNDN